MAGKNYASLIMLLPSLIQFAESIHGAKSGRQKLATVTALAQNAILTASAAGILDATMATNTASIVDSIEHALAGMKSSDSLEKQ